MTNGHGMTGGHGGEYPDSRPQAIEVTEQRAH